MNIKITYNWLLEYLDTDASPYEIQKYLSLCGPSVESVTKILTNYVFDIEITTNRIDMASVFGIAQEALAILPQFGKKAKLKINPLVKYRFSQIDNGLPRNELLQIKILDKNLCSRFTAIVLENIKIKPSPDFISKRLNLCAVKSINNVIDISNYLMLTLGQPTHVFDYDKIKDHKMIMRLSKKNEKITTLDEKEINLPGGDIVIEDGSGNLIDLCGIMGGLNSAVSNKTKSVVLFVQTYNKQLIRKTSMITGQRTVAAAYFEKGLDEERVEPTLTYGIEFFKKYAEAKPASKIYDVYPKSYKKKSIDISYQQIEEKIGVKISKGKIIRILSSLGFKYHLTHDRDDMVIIDIPSYRNNDISIKEDIVEEVARIYGYHNLPSIVQTTTLVKQPKEIEDSFNLQSKIKHFLKHLGLHEVMNYSMISKQMILNNDLKPENHLRIKNTISEEIEYMRTNLIPSLIKNIKENEGKTSTLQIFEIAKTYKPQKDNLPNEEYKLGIVTNSSFSDLKGIIEALLKELNIEKYEFNVGNTHACSLSANLIINNKPIGFLGQFITNVFLAEIDFQSLIDNYKPLPAFKPINPYAVIKLDLTIELNKNKTYDLIKKKSFEVSKLLQNLELIDLYQNKATIRFYFSSTERNITEEEAKEEFDAIKI